MPKTVRRGDAASTGLRAELKAGRSARAEARRIRNLSYNISEVMDALENTNSALGALSALHEVDASVATMALRASRDKLIDLAKSLRSEGALSERFDAAVADGEL